MRGYKTVTISYNGEELDILGYYYPYYMGTMEQPPENEDFEIETIIYKGQDVTDLVCALLPNLDKITELCLEKIN